GSNLNGNYRPKWVSSKRQSTAEGLKHALAALSSAQQQLEAQASGAFSPRGEWLMRNIETLREVRRRAGQDPHQKVNHRLEGPRRELHNLYGPQLLTLKDTVKALFSELPAVEFSDPTDYTEAMRQQQVLWSQAALMVDRYLTGAPASIEAAALSELLDYFPSYPDFLAELKKRIAADEARYVLAETLVALPTRDTTTS
ncbi:hypothetical protein, partial [Falsigemmobacter intermedius]|uniref:hypothetical protein n=2 Tax=Falsigemmobacter intermedius TaxID=1553448 RepID=UPI0013E3E85F